MRQRILVLILGIVLFLGWMRLCIAASGYQAKNLGYVNLYISSATAASILATTPTAVGQLIYCYNCVDNGGAGTICISTESTTSKNGFVLSTGTACQ